MLRLILVLLVATALAPRAEADPWPREQGTAFLAASGTYRFAALEAQGETEWSVYAEYGLPRRLTAGLDLLENTSGGTHAFAFLRTPLRPPERTLKLAVSAGAGATREFGQWAPTLRLGLSVGSATQFWRSGWWATRATFEHRVNAPDPLFKLDTTLGFNLSPRVKAFFDLEASDRRGSRRSITLRSSAAWALGRGHSWVLGLEGKDTSVRQYGIRLGFWSTF